jgi:hypothetical protein
MLMRRPEAQVHLDRFEVLLDRPVALARATMRNPVSAWFQ